jgi:hypothetical protein
MSRPDGSLPIIGGGQDYFQFPTQIEDGLGEDAVGAFGEATEPADYMPKRIIPAGRGERCWALHESSLSRSSPGRPPEHGRDEE